MGVAGGKNAIRLREARIFLDREKKVCRRLTKLPTCEMSVTHHEKCGTDPGAGTEPKRGFSMFDCNVGLTRPQPEETADVPAARIVRVERQRPINQRHHRTKVLAKIGTRVS